MKLILIIKRLSGLLTLAFGLVVAGGAIAQDEASMVEFKVQPVAPNGRLYYQVIAYFDADYAPPVLAIRSAVKPHRDVHGKLVPGLSMEDRAQIIADRLTKLQATVPGWYTKDRLKAQRYKNGEFVVSPTGVAGIDYIATADSESVGPMNCKDRSDLANKLKDMIEAAFEVGPLTGATRAAAIRGHETQQSLVFEGDKLFEDDPAQAKLSYEKALKLAHGKYVYVELALAQLYLNEGERAKARQMLTSIAAQNPNPADLAVLAKLQAQLK